ncbi:DNA (cytosine-5-)-methyltransferase [Streptomyces sp. AP-93]|uniref:DNA (cytosine-5-)-methyltransferase n=1 Tax=Streptomyces sp. AP-93 TaxID=2929048 RepID=UPI001FAE92E0|nr:DNA (cytosine-5-)-methyltransferase [Streptomyces sp. AP-93]MCJ0872915.1 DNA (cytosine-5-)-methyltransferase [Streptomyces sp. AP-93]
MALLKTPTSNLGSNGGSQHPDKRKAGGHGPTLADEIELLPTPRASDGSKGSPNQRYGNGSLTLASTAATLAVPSTPTGGRFEPAIRRWERATRPAPAPVDERRRLAPAFVEWMMGLPEGHVTDVPGLSRGAQLHLLGNGVVPQQATCALGILLPDGISAHHHARQHGTGAGGQP